MARNTIKYQTNAGVLLNLSLSDAKIALAGDAPAGNVVQKNLFASVQGSKRRRNSIVVRGVNYAYREPTESGLFGVRTLFIPKVTQAALAATTEAPVQYKGLSYAFVSVREEG